jgi:nitrogenase molybdenum-iron protein alpha/beta subunit
VRTTPQPYGLHSTGWFLTEMVTKSSVSREFVEESATQLRRAEQNLCERCRFY